MGTGRTDEFRKGAVWIALTSGLSRRQVAYALGVGLSTLNKWVNAHRDTDVISAEDRELARENERLRREIRITASGLHLPQRSRQPILFTRLSEGPARSWPETVDERQSQLL